MALVIGCDDFTKILSICQTYLNVRLGTNAKISFHEVSPRPRRSFPHDRWMSQLDPRRTINEENGRYIGAFDEFWLEIPRRPINEAN